MSLYERVANLPLTIDRYHLEPLSRTTPAGWTRRTTVVVLEGGGHQGVGEDVTYQLSGNNLQLIDDQGTATLNENITDFEFIYFDASGAATTVTENIRSVGITLTATTPAGSAAPVERTYNTLIRCRNIGL